MADSNNRIFYACQTVFLDPGCSGNLVPIHGAQSIGINTNFNLEQAFELGQAAIYENIEGLADVEVTLEKVLDGYPLIFHAATSGASPRGLLARSKVRTSINLGIYEDGRDYATGIPPIELWMSGMYLNNITYTLNTDGNFTESATFVGNHKQWYKGTGGKITADLTTSANASGQDQPSGLFGLGGIQRRENVLLASSILPQSIFGVNGSGVGNAVSGVHIQTMSISADLGRDPILELGRKAPYFRAPKVPIEVKCDIEVIAISGDLVDITESGNPAYTGVDLGNNLKYDSIKIVLQDGTSIDMGDRCKLQSVSYGGGDAGGGNVSLKYSFVGYNILKVEHPKDPGGSSYSYALPPQEGYSSYSKSKDL